MGNMGAAVDEKTHEDAGLLREAGDRDISLNRASTGLRQAGPKWPWFLLLLSLSCGMTIANKLIMLHYHFANTLMLLQNSTATLVLWLCYIFGCLDTRAFTLAQVRTFLLPSVFLTLEMYTSLLALPYVAIATTVIFRNVSLFIVAFFDWLCMGQHFTVMGVLGLCLVVGGSVLYAEKDITFNATGYFWLGTNAFVYVFACFYNKYYISKSIQTPGGIALITNTASLPCIVFTAFVHKENMVQGAQALETLLSHPAPSPQSTAMDPSFLVAGNTPGVNVGFVVLASSIGALLISTTYAKVYKIASATAVTVCGNISKALGILGGCWIFGTVLSRMQIVGLAVCMAGGLQYSVASKGTKRVVQKQDARHSQSDFFDGKRPAPYSDRDTTGGDECRFERDMLNSNGVELTKMHPGDGDCEIDGGGNSDDDRDATLDEGLDSSSFVRSVEVEAD